MKKAVSVLLVLVLAASLFGCASRQSASSASTVSTSEGGGRYSYLAWDVFDTMARVVGYADSQEDWDAQMEALHADLLRYHQLYDIYNEYDGINNLCTINKKAGIAPVKVDTAILDLLELAKEMEAVTNGRMDISQGALLSVWHDYRTAGIANPDEAALPTREELENAAQHSGLEYLQIDRAAGTAYITDPAVQLDVGSIGKGYAVEQAALAARARGLDNAFLNIGGNLRAIGAKPEGNWVGGVENPWGDTSNYITTVNVPDGYSLVISGDYQRYYTVNGEKYHHLIDFTTLQPARYMDSVAVLCPDSGRADALSTGLFCMSVEDGKALVDSLDGVEAIWMLTDGSVTATDGFADYQTAP